MTFSLSGVFAEAVALWRSERRLIVPVASVFFFVPMLAVVLLLDGIKLSPDATPEQMETALKAFYDANILPLLLISLLMDFGLFALLNLFQGGGRTLGEVLATALRRFFLFEIVAIISRVLLTIGASLFLLPGLFAFARTWLAGPALAARPEGGIGGAFRDGWMLSRNLAWLTLLGVVAVVCVAGGLLLMTVAILFGLAAAAIGDMVILPVLGYVACAILGSMVWVALALLSTAAYRLAVAKQGI